MNQAEVEQIKAQALIEAKRLHKEAQEQADPELYKKAAEYYYTAGKNTEWNHCLDVAERLQNGGAK
jgi:hypothetical protein